MHDVLLFTWLLTLETTLAISFNNFVDCRPGNFSRILHLNFSLPIWPVRGISLADSNMFFLHDFRKTNCSTAVSSISLPGSVHLLYSTPTDGRIEIWCDCVIYQCPYEHLLMYHLGPATLLAWLQTILIHILFDLSFSCSFYFQYC